MYNNYNPFAGIAQSVKNFFKPPRTVSPAPAPPPNANPYGYGQFLNPAAPNTQMPQYYQVRENDTFASIGRQFNLNEQDLQQANGVVPPPKGSYIELPRPGFPAAPQAAGAPADLSAYNASERGLTPSANGPARPDLRWMNERYDVIGQLSSGILPKTISDTARGAIINPNTGQPLTSAELLAGGYTFNQASNSWVLSPNAPANQQGSGDGGGGGDFNPRNVRVKFNEGGHNEFDTNLKWAINAWKRQSRGGSGGGPGNGNGTNRGKRQPGGTPSTTLNLHLGSG